MEPDYKQYRCPGLIHVRESLEEHQRGKSLDLLAGDGGAGLLIISPSIHTSHEDWTPVMVDRDSLPNKVIHHPVSAAKGLIPVRRVDPGHDPQRRLPRRLSR